MSLVGEKCVFKLSVKGENTRKTYKGDFVLKLFLTLRERSNVAVEVSKIDNGNLKDSMMTGLTQLVCELQALVEQSPEWFKSDTAWDLLDLQPILSIKEELDQAIAEYLKTQDE
jgi:hypothetical protein